ncbi:MAG: hypothetical protein KA385_08360 [Vicinamibacteria bacterium]|jgi:hypothetical protein|nr:hypothetical protein [Vicinamibacteria bacterium]
MEENERTDRQARMGSDYLRTQVRAWMEGASESGRKKELFELEMWLRALDRFFKPAHHALSDEQINELPYRDWSAELAVVDLCLLRVGQLCSHLLPRDKADEAQFKRYVDGFIREAESADPYFERLLRDARPEAGLLVLRGTLEDVRLLVAESLRAQKTPLQIFESVGRIFSRELRRNPPLAALLDKKFKPMFDKVTSSEIAGLIRAIGDPGERNPVARVFLELFRMLKYLEHANPDSLPDDRVKTAACVFSLVISEARQLVSYIEKRALVALPHGSQARDACDSIAYCMPIDINKVVRVELADLSSVQSPENVRSRIENAHGILKDCFQQSVVQLASALDAGLTGVGVFSDFVNKKERSLALKKALEELLGTVRAFYARGDEPSAVALRDGTARFYDRQLRHLMYRDWSAFEQFFVEILKCNSLTALKPITHRYETFLQTLLREVEKRAVLQSNAA